MQAIVASESSNIRLNARFSNWESFHRSFRCYTVQKHFTVTNVKRDHSRYLAQCKGFDMEPTPCPFRIRAIHSSKSNDIEVTQLTEEHTCPANIHECRTASWHNSKFVEELIGEHVKANQSLNPKDIILDMRLQSGVQLPYHTAYRAKQKCLDYLNGDEKESFNKIPLFTEKVKELNPGSVTYYEVDDQKRFIRSFIAPAPCIRLYNSCRMFACVDATFLKTLTFPRALI